MASVRHFDYFEAGPNGEEPLAVGWMTLEGRQVLGGFLPQAEPTPGKLPFTVITTVRGPGTDMEQRSCSGWVVC